MTTDDIRKLGDNSIDIVAEEIAALRSDRAVINQTISGLKVSNDEGALLLARLSRCSARISRELRYLLKVVEQRTGPPPKLGPPPRTNTVQSFLPPLANGLAAYKRVEGDTRLM